MSTTTLVLSTGTSRGRDTFGYTIVRATDVATGKVYKCMGGGYDMVGTVVADWLEDVHQGGLRAISDRAYYRLDNGDRVHLDGLYGMTTRTDGAVSVDGACGIKSVIRVGEVVGLHFQRTFNRRTGRTTGYIVTDPS